MWAINDLDNSLAKNFKMPKTPETINIACIAIRLELKRVWNYSTCLNMRLIQHKPLMESLEDLLSSILCMCFQSFSIKIMMTRIKKTFSLSYKSVKNDLWLVHILNIMIVDRFISRVFQTIKITFIRVQV